MPIEQAWVTKFPKALENQNISIDVINASISGDTTGNGLARLPQLLATHSPDYVLIELGANDGLRGFPVKVPRNNLQQIIQQIQDASASPIMMQIRIPPNYGKRYTESFEKMYQELSKSNDIPLIPFFLEQVIIKPEWMKSDGLHPNEKAQPWIADFVAEAIAPYL